MDRPYGTIRSVQYGILDEKTIRKIAVTKVDDPVIHKAGVVKHDGVNASSMGTTTSNMLCSTCGCDTESCPGHFGRILLHEPVINFEFLKVLFKILSSVCFNCSRLLLPKSHPRYKYVCSVECPERRRMLIYNIASKINVCQAHKSARGNGSDKKEYSSSHVEGQVLEDFVLEKDGGGDSSRQEEDIFCGARQPVYVKSDVGIRCVFRISIGMLENCVAAESVDSIPVLTPSTMYKILEHISDADVELLGLDPKHSRPERMMWKNFLVPPVPLRPTKSNIFGTTSKIVGEDDLTKRIRIILKLSLLLEQVSKNTPSSEQGSTSEEYSVRNKADGACNRRYGFPSASRFSEIDFPLQMPTVPFGDAPPLLPESEPSQIFGGMEKNTVSSYFEDEQKGDEELNELIDRLGTEDALNETMVDNIRSVFRRGNTISSFLETMYANINLGKCNDFSGMYKALCLDEERSAFANKDIFLSTYVFGDDDVYDEEASLYENEHSLAERFLGRVFCQSTSTSFTKHLSASGHLKRRGGAVTVARCKRKKKLKKKKAGSMVGSAAAAVTHSTGSDMVLCENTLTFHTLAELVCTQIYREKKRNAAGGGMVRQEETAKCIAENVCLDWVVNTFMVARKPVSVSNKSLFPTSRSCPLEVYTSLQRNVTSYHDNRTKSTKDDYFALCRKTILLLKNKTVHEWLQENKLWIINRATSRVLQNDLFCDNFLDDRVLRSFVAQAFQVSLPGLPKPCDVAAGVFPAQAGEDAERACVEHLLHAAEMVASLPFGDRAKSFTVPTAGGGAGKSGSNISHITSNKRLRMSLRQKFSGTTSKEGVMRKRVCGKRQNQSARTVITPDTFIEPDELGVPVQIAMTVTYPDTVFSFNHHVLLEAIRNGPFKYPGANYFQRKGKGQLISLEYGATKGHCAADGIELEEGDVVYRHLRNGDLVLFNRQPSLHKNSLMAHRVRVMPGKSFRVHMAVTKSYNADFDGDEMVMQPCQTVEGRAEALCMLHVGSNMVKDGATIVTFQQHSVAGAYLLSKTPRTFSRQDVQQILFQGFEGAGSKIIRLDFFPPEQFSFTGKDIITALLPPNLTVSYGSEADPGGKVCVLQGKYVSGHLTKSALNDGILMSIWKDCGKETAFSFITAGYRVFEYALKKFGMTVGYSDCNFPKTERDKAIIQKALEFVDKFPDHSPSEKGQEADIVEQKITTVMDKTRDVVGATVMGKMLAKERADPDGRGNKLKEIIDSGAKGNLTNIMQIAGLVGQQCDHKSGRITTSLKHLFANSSGTALLPHNLAKAHGMVDRSFFEGLRSTDFFCHLIGARGGLVDTAVKTSETGYAQRKIAYKTQDHVLQHDGSVADSGGEIVEFLYGNDGCSSDPIERVALGLLQPRLFSMDAFHREYQFNVTNYSSSEFSFLHDQELSRLRFLQQTLLENMVGEGLCTNVLTPVHLERMLVSHRAEANADNLQNSNTNTTTSSFSPLDLLRSVNAFWSTHGWTRDPQSGSSTKNPNSLFYASLHFEALFRHHFSTKNLWERFGVRSQASLEGIFKKLRKQLVSTMGQAGESVGMKASQNCSEPFTQLNLNRFHRSGEFSHLVDGVARMKEIINATHDPKTPSMTIFLSPHDHEKQVCSVLGTKEDCEYLRAEEFGSDIVSVTGRDVVAGVSVGLCSPLSKENTFRREIVVQQAIIWDDHVAGEVGFHANLFDSRKKLLMFVELDSKKLRLHNCNSADVCTALLHSPFAKKFYHLEQNLFFYDALRFDEKSWMCIALDKTRSDAMYSKTKTPLTKHARLRQGAMGPSSSSTYASEQEVVSATDLAVANQIYQKIICKLFIRGVPGIKDFYVETVSILTKGLKAENPNDLQYQQERRHVVVTKGSNLGDILQMGAVDKTLTTTNDIREIESVLGIDAARKSISKNWIGVMQSNNVNVSFRHIDLISRAMCTRGKIMPMNYTGIGHGSHTSVVKMACFEKALDSFLQGAVRGQGDRIKGTMDSIFLNSRISAGVHHSDVTISQTHSLMTECDKEEESRRSVVAIKNFKHLASRVAMQLPIATSTLKSICANKVEQDPLRSKKSSSAIISDKQATSMWGRLKQSYDATASDKQKLLDARQVPPVTVTRPSLRIFDAADVYKKNHKKYLKRKRETNKTTNGQMYPLKATEGTEASNGSSVDVPPDSSPKSPIYDCGIRNLVHAADNTSNSTLDSPVYVPT